MSASLLSLRPGAVVVPSGAEPKSRRWLTRGAIGTYCFFVVVPAVVAALHGGVTRGDARKDARAFAQAYGSDVAAYFAGAPRAAKMLELSALIVLPLVLYVLALPAAGVRPSLRDLGRAAVGSAALIFAGHGVVFVAMLAGGGSGSVAWSWMWRLSALTLISSAATLGAIALAVTWLRQRRLLAVSLLVLLAVTGVALRFYQACGVPWLPGCVDAALLSGRAETQLSGTLVAGLWVTLALASIRFTRAAKTTPSPG